MGKVALWMSRLTMLFIAPGLPLVIAIGQFRASSGAGPISPMRVGVSILLALAVIISLIYSVTRWSRPPLWASVLARVSHYRDW